jgi:excinuclease ABC subunit A
MNNQPIKIRGARVHNLKNIDVDIPRKKMIVVTGPSGSGKSSLAFDTLYAEGQRRYVESLSSFAHQYLDQLPKPDVDKIEGLSPALAIDQKGLGNNPRSTVGTITEISNYLRLLYARCGTATCPDCEVLVTTQPLSEIKSSIARIPDGSRIWLLSPLISGRKGVHKNLLENLQDDGYLRVLIDGEMLDLDDEINLAPGKRHDIAVVVDGFVQRPDVDQRLNEAVTVASELSGGSVLVKVDKELKLFSRNASCPSCGKGFPEVEPRSFSFNSPAGLCQKCHGLGTTPTITIDSLVPDQDLSISEGAIEFLRGKETGWIYTQIEALSTAMGFALDAEWKSLPDEAAQTIVYGLSDEVRQSVINHKLYDAFIVEWSGLAEEFLRRYRETKSEKVRSRISKLMTPLQCSSCNGYRLRPESLAVLVGGLHIGQVSKLAISELLVWAQGLKFDNHTKSEVAEPVLQQVTQRSKFLSQVGVEYLSIDRGVSTLSGGEGQRVRLATQVGSKLTGVLYVLDEPSVGLHHRDIHRLIDTLQTLRDRGNTVIVVEHDLDIMLAADYLLDIGPGAGEHGGLLVATGTPEEVSNNNESETGRWLRDRQRISSPAPSSGDNKPTNWLKMTGLVARNLKNIELEIPLHQLTVVTGVSGSGKSTAVNDTLYRALACDLNRASLKAEKFDSLSGTDKLSSVILVDQSPIGRSPRSTPATYSNLMTPLRKLFAETNLAKMRGYGPGRFSFNAGDGRCSECEGAGVRRITMDFLPDVEVDCQECNGKRYNRETLEVHFKGRSMSDVLNMPVEEALEFFANIPSCRKILKLMNDVGLGYMRLGQVGATLSGGEAQRLKLARELARGKRKDVMYILDEPTTGLHFCDVDRLMDILARIVSEGHSVIVIEHNPEVIRRADWIIDLGPEGGANGGEVLIAGNVNDVANCQKSYTGKMLRDLLAGC